MITRDTSASYSTTNAIFTQAYTNAGNMITVEVPYNDGSLPSFVTFNGINLTNIIIGGANSQFWYLANPFVGTANVVITRSVGGQMLVDFASYAGCSSAQPDASNKVTITTGKILTITINVVRPNCWLLGTAFGSGTTGNLTAFTSNKTDRETNTYIAGAFTAIQTFCDSNGTVGTGSQSITWTGVDSDPDILATGAVISLAPFIPATGNGLFMISD